MHKKQILLTFRLYCFPVLSSSSSDVRHYNEHWKGKNTSKGFTLCFKNNTAFYFRKISNKKMKIVKNTLKQKKISTLPYPDSKIVGGQKQGSINICAIINATL